MKYLLFAIAVFFSLEINAQGIRIIDVDTLPDGIWITNEFGNKTKIAENPNPKIKGAVYGNELNSGIYDYCLIVGTANLLQTKVTIEVDFGQKKTMWYRQRYMDESTGKPKVFNSMIDAINFFSQNGWEFVDAYAITMQYNNVYHYLLKRKQE
jgi:hypothetical protein